jgi:hypothetical protein
MQRVSIIITTHNRPRLLSRAVASARLSGRDPEIVVVDDASTDETGEVCRSLPDISYIRVDHQQGVACARNLGLKASSGEFISFLDDDDERLPGARRQPGGRDRPPRTFLRVCGGCPPRCCACPSTGAAHAPRSACSVVWRRRGELEFHNTFQREVRSGG